MAVNVLDIRPQKGFNQIFTRLINNAPAAPSYNPRYKSQFFFLKKRDGIQSLLLASHLSVIDMEIYQDNNKIEYWVLSWNKGLSKYEIWVREDGWGYTQHLTFDSDVKPYFTKVLAGGQARLDSGTASGGSATSLSDSTKTRTDNQRAGNYVYIVDWTWAGQLRNIVSNTANTLNVSGFDAAPDATSQYIIYEMLTYNLVVHTSSGLLVYDWIAWENSPVFQWYNISQVVVWEWRLWRTVDNRLFYSKEWDPYYSTDPYLLLSSNNIYSLYPHSWLLFIGTDVSLNIVYKIPVWTGVVYDIKEWVSSQWLRNEDALLSFRGGLYMLSNDNKLFAVTLQIDWSNIQTTLTTQWEMPAAFLAANEAGIVKLYTDWEYLYMYGIDGDTTPELVYDSFYEWWFENEYMVRVNKKKMLNGIEYYLWDGFIGKKWWTKDIDKDFGQIIEFVVWEPDIWSTKDMKYLLVLLGKASYQQGGTLTVDWMLTTFINSKTHNLEGASSITNWNTLVDTTIGSNLLWMVWLWWDKSALDEQSSVIGIIKVNIWQASNLFRITIQSTEWKNGLFFGGAFVYYDQLNTFLQNYNNVI